MTVTAILVAALMGTAPTSSSGESMANRSPPVFSPYASTAANFMYNLLFCDRRDSFRGADGQKLPQRLGALFSEPPDVPGLTQITGDESEEGRIRYLAFARLREAGAPVKPKILLGVVIEVGLDDGLDTLAAFSEGGVRYINHSGRIIVVEGADQFRPLVNRLFESASLVVARIGPWDQPRRPPPGKGYMRLTFLVSDGLYFGEGRMDTFAQDALAGPVFRDGTELLQKAVATVKKD